MLLHSAALPRRVLTPIHTASASRCVIACPDAATRPLASLDALTLSSSSTISSASPSSASAIGGLTASAIGAVDCASCTACLGSFACADGCSSAAPRGFHGTARGAAGLAASFERGLGSGPGTSGGGGGASQLRASHVASAASKELLRLTNATGGGGGVGGAGYASGFYGGGEGPLSVLLAARRSELVAAAALGRSLGLGERAFKVAAGGGIVAADDVIRGALAALSVGNGGLGAASASPAKPIQPVHLAMLTLAAASASAALVRPGEDSGPSVLRSVACEAAAVGAVHASVDARKASTTDYHVVRIPGDGRCLFHAVAHGHHARASLPQPTALPARCQLADALRNQVADEFVKRREETEWFLEGNFDDYVANIRKPYVWGGEPELLMLSHVLKSPITVFIADPRSPRSGAIMPIAEYGREYASKQEGDERRVEGEGISSSKDAICVLYNGSSHYDALLIPRSAAVEGTQQQQQARL
ncbi:unnamed protein product [Closterium sp. NIES-64]|nr:unnamed protein product [Closterium sp. NIES-64]